MITREGSSERLPTSSPPRVPAETACASEGSAAAVRNAGDTGDDSGRPVSLDEGTRDVTQPGVSSRPLPPHASGASRLLVAVMTAATLALGGSVAADARSAGAADAALDRALRELVEMPGGPPGAIAIVQRGSSLRVHAFGVAALGASGRPRKNDHIRIASVAKAFSGAVALSLVDEGVLSLDDTVGRWLPGQPSAWHAVTLRQLLGHTSGLPDFAESEAWSEAAAGSLAVAPPPAALLAFVADEPLTFTPGTQYRYSNSDNIAVGLMVEAATRTSYEEALRNQVLQPLGLRRTSLPAGPQLPAPFIHGYDLEADGERPRT